MLILRDYHGMNAHDLVLKIVDMNTVVVVF
jgi:hypothetical protein